jgi:hypothetical protein
MYKVHDEKQENTPIPIQAVMKAIANKVDTR